jgi:hypothetical protein
LSSSTRLSTSNPYPFSNPAGKETREREQRRQGKEGMVIYVSIIWPVVSSQSVASSLVSSRQSVTTHTYTHTHTQHIHTTT